MYPISQQPDLTLLTRGPGIMEAGKSFLKRFGNNRGPLAVEENLVKGLRKINAKFNINPKDNELAKNICVLRSAPASLKAVELSGNHTVILGPNLPAAELAKYAKSTVKFFLAPSKEVKFAYIHYGVPGDKVVVWPVGIDSEKFGDFSKSQKKYDCLLYYKRRRPEELQEVMDLLNQNKQTFLFLEYGKYVEEDLVQAVQDCRYAVILDGTESQGIAIENIMSSNLPLFVFDQIFLGVPHEEYINENLRVTSVPYWSDVCGVRVPTDTFGKSKNHYLPIPDTADEFKGFMGRLESFKPRQYILENLTLEKQAKEFLEIFK